MWIVRPAETNARSVSHPPEEGIVVFPDEQSLLKPDTFGTSTWWLVTKDTVGSADVVVNLSLLPHRTAHQLHRHPHADQVILVVRGRGQHLREHEQPTEVTAGDVVYIPRGEWHGFANPHTQTVKIASIYGGVGTREAAGYELHGSQHDFESPKLSPSSRQNKDLG